MTLKRRLVKNKITDLEEKKKKIKEISNKYFTALHF